MVKAVNIKWVTDGENVELPKEMEIPDKYIDDKGIDYEGVSDWLSDTTGWLHDGFGISNYQLSRPTIETIIDYCNDLEASEKLEVYEFGEKCDLVLHIYKDEDYDPVKDKDLYNLVTIHTAQKGEWVDDTEDTYVTDGTLYRELERIYHYKDFGTL